MSVEERVKKTIAFQLGTAIEDIHDGPFLVEDLGADSLDTVELVLALEEEFDNELDSGHDEEIENRFEENGDITVEQIINFVKEFFEEE